jgi:hypothetical protein
MAITTIQTFAEYTNISPSSFMPIVDINENTNSKNKKISIADLRKYFYTNQNLSRSFASHTPGLYYFGDNSDGPGNFSGSITALRTRITSSFSSSLDGPPVIKNFSSLFVSRSVVISPPRRCRGMLIFVDGDATISGSITMTARGANFVGADASFTVVNPPYVGDYWSAINFPSSSYLNRVFAAGASGGGGAPSPLGVDGFTGTGGRSGGGGAGSSYGAPAGSNGSAGTSFSGGSGGGGANVSPVLAGQSASPNGGAGGNGAGTGGGGGAGNPGGSGGGGGGEGTGGLLILIVRGNLKIGPNGSITTNGSNGAPSTPAPTSGGAGGGSGGGILYVYYGGTLTNNGTVTANGGSRGPLGNINPAGNGGAGTAILSRLNVAFPVGN